MLGLGDDRQGEDDGGFGDVVEVYLFLRGGKSSMFSRKGG
jgi:hypothetical protein